MLKTLLHELCHAMMRKFSCLNEFCGDVACWDQWEMETGRGGHGTAWESLAEFLEGYTEDDLPSPTTYFQ